MMAFVAKFFVFVECVRFWFANQKVLFEGAQFARLGDGGKLLALVYELPGKVETNT